MGDVIKFAEEIYGFKIFAAAILIGNPLTLFSRVIEVKHGGNGVHAQAVYVVAFAPEEGVGDKEITDFMAAEIKNQRAPILVSALPWVFVLVKGRAVEIGQGPIVAREMSGNPINENADASLMEGIDKELKIIRS